MDNKEYKNLAEMIGAPSYESRFFPLPEWEEKILDSFGVLERFNEIMHEPVVFGADFANNIAKGTVTELLLILEQAHYEAFHFMLHFLHDKELLVEESE